MRWVWRLATWKDWKDVAALFIGADRNDYGVIHQVSVQRAVLNRIHGVVHGFELPFERFDELKPIQIRGVYIIPVVQ